MGKLSKYKFSDLYSMSSGISSKPEQAGHGYPFASFSTIFNNYFLPHTLPDLMNTSEREQETYSIKKGDIFLTRTSETIDELGMSCVALKDYPKATYSGFVKRLRPMQNSITYDKFMGFYLRGKFFRKTMTNNAIMTLRASLNEDIFSYLNLYLPDYDTQRNIGDTLHLINSKIALNKRINAELEVISQMTFNYWFVQFDFPDLKEKPYKSSGGKMIWNEQLKRNIPDGWIDGKLSHIGNIVGGSTPSKNVAEYFDEMGIAWITPKDLSLNGTNKFITKGEVSVSEMGIKAASLNIMPKGTVLLSSRAPIGYMAIARENVTTNQGFKSFVPLNDYTIPFIFYTVKNSLPTILNHSSGSTFKEVSATVLKTISICLPPPTVILKYTHLVEAIFERQNILEMENEKLSELRDWLLPMVINGQVKVGL